MTRFIHDRFAKDYLETLLTPYGEVQPARKIRSEQREIDLLFLPSMAVDSSLGLLAQLAETAAIFEPFRNPVTKAEISSCLLKALELREEIQRQAKRKQAEDSRSLPRLWILTPTASPAILEGWGAIYRENSPSGLYFLPDFLATAILVIHQLPRTPDTLWLRMLGWGKVQQRAIEELAALEVAASIREKTLELFYELQENLRLNQSVDPEDRELVMRLQPLFQERIARIQAESRQEGRQEGEGIVIENLLKVRFGALDPELAATIPRILQLPPEEFTPLLLHLSREELVNRFSRSLDSGD